MSILQIFEIESLLSVGKIEHRVCLVIERIFIDGEISIPGSLFSDRLFNLFSNVFFFIK